MHRRRTDWEALPERQELWLGAHYNRVAFTPGFAALSVDARWALIRQNIATSDSSYGLRKAQLDAVDSLSPAERVALLEVLERRAAWRSL